MRRRKVHPTCQNRSHVAPGRLRYSLLVNRTCVVCFKTRQGRQYVHVTAAATVCCRRTGDTHHHQPSGFVLDDFFIWLKKL